MGVATGWAAEAQKRESLFTSAVVESMLMAARYAIRSAHLPTPSQKRESLFTAAIIGSMYAATGLSAILYPGSAGCDPDLCGPEGTFVQKYVFRPSLLLTWIGYALEARRV